ncbi:MAG TPA: GH32 C-terminal domain-containing protein, partial [Kribbella sp.]
RMRVSDAFDPSSGRPAARIFLDGSVLEVFTSAGRVLSTRVYPTTPPTWQLEAPPDAHFWTLDR